MKKSICTLLALSIALAVFSGCSKEDKQQTDEKGRTKLTYACWVSGPVNNNSVIEKKLEEKFPDVDFEFIPFERDTWQQQLNTRVAGGDIPDIIYRDHVYYIKDFAKQNLIAEVPFSMVKECAPDVVKATMEYGPSVWLSCNVNGKNYGIPFMQPNQKYPSTDAWRMDWLQNVGINKIPETLDEYEEAFRRFVNNDPDKNGVNDTYGLSYNVKSSPASMFKTIFAAYGTIDGSWMFDKDNNIVFGSVTPQAKQALTKLNEWYNEGLIDPEFVTTDTAAVKQKFINGKIGFIPASTWYRLIQGGEIYEGLMTVNPQAKLEMGPAPKGPDGSFGYGQGKESEDGPITSSVVFSQKLESNPDKLKLALRVLNKMMSDKEIYGLLRYGVEGENWERDENNGVKPIPPYNLAQNCGDLGNNFFASFNAIPSVQDEYQRKDIGEITKYARMGNVHPIDSWIDYFVSQDDMKTGDKVQIIANKWYTNFILGKEPLSKFDSFVNEWYSSGGQQLTNAYNEAYKTGGAKKQEILDQIK